MGFSLFGGSGDNKTSTTTTTTVTDASATAAEGATSLSGGSQLTSNITNIRTDASPEIARDAFRFGTSALEANTDVAGKALDTGVDALRISANLVPNLLAAQSDQTSAVLKASQENANLGAQFASIGASLGRGAQTGGVSTLFEGPVPLIIGAVILGGLYFALRKKA